MIYRNVDELRLSNGELPTVSSLGCYPLFYLTDCNEVVCPECANTEEAFQESDFPGDNLVSVDVNYESECLYCEVCDERIPSAYGED